MDNEKYYSVKRKGDGAYPMVKITNLRKVEDGEEVILKTYMAPVVSKPVMADYLRSAKEIFSKRVVNAMQAMGMEGVHFYPAEVEGAKGVVHDGYVCVDVEDNTYKLLDLEKSDYRIDDEIDENNPLYYVKKVVIDREKLCKIPLNERLGMCIDEVAGYHLYHQSVVDAVMALEPTGMYFKDIEEETEFY
jgi:hypothetical protein